MNLNSSSIPSLYHTVKFPASIFCRSVFYRSGSGYQNPLMDTDIVKTRRERLRELIKTRFGGKQSRMVDETGINAGELSGLLRTKHFGEKKARAIEDQLGLPALWMDGDTKEPPIADSGELLELWEWLLPGEKQAELERIRPMAARNKEAATHFQQVVRVVDRRKRQVSFEHKDDRRRKEDEQ